MARAWTQNAAVKRVTRSSGGQSSYNDEKASHAHISPTIPVNSRGENINGATSNSSDNLVDQIKRRWESSNSGNVESETKTTPILSRLRYSAGRQLGNKQRILLGKHQEAKSRIESLSVGGGISIWPEMDNMRLTGRDTFSLICFSVFLCAVTYWTFYCVHGQLYSDLNVYYIILTTFTKERPLVIDGGNVSFRESILKWHADFRHTMAVMHNTFDVSLAESSIAYQSSVAVYVVIIGILLYYLADNVLAKSRLTPSRIKQWVLLLIVTATWTILGIKLLVMAQSVESAVEETVHEFGERLGDLVDLDLDSTTYHDVLLYWTRRCLPPMSLGTLRIMGLFAVRDVAYYLQYYSLPVISALLMPVVKLIWSLYEIYAVRHH